MLIIEGSDLVGKTTLCKKLLKRLDNAMQYCHFGKLPEDWDYLYDYLPFIHPRACLDRFHLSEVTYGTVIEGREPGFTHAQFDLLEANCVLAGAFTVVLTADAKVINSRFHEYGDDTMNLATILKVNQAFKSMCSLPSFNGFSPRIHYKMQIKHTSWTEQIDDIFEKYCDHINAFRKAID